MNLLIQDIPIIPVTEPGLIIKKGYIVVEGDKITDIGNGTAPDGNYDYVIRGNNRLAIPGMVNTHTHAAMTLLRGYADDMPLMEWLEQKIWPLEAKLRADDIFWGTKLALIEMIKSGTTAFADMYFAMGKVAQAVEEAGIRGVLARGMIGVGPENDKAFQETVQLFENWHQKAAGRITIMLGPHAPYTCPPEYMKRVEKLAADLRIGIQVHVAETRAEVDDINKMYGKTPVEYLEDLGLFNHRVIASHCVYLTPADIMTLKKYDVGVAHNPESNMKLASGIAPVPAMLNAGITVGIGTDGASSNNNLDMIQEMRSCSLLHKVNSMDPTVIPAYQALEMATKMGAKVLGLEHETGQLKPGFKADIVLLRLDGAHMCPSHDYLANLVYAAQASDVDTVIVNGKIIMENKIITTLDETEVLHQCRKIARRLVS